MRSHMFEEATYVVYPGQSIFQLPEVERPKKIDVVTSEWPWCMGSDMP